MRKRKLIAIGKPKALLTLHETFTWLGALMILVHAGVHVYAILPWLELAAMMIGPGGVIDGHAEFAKDCFACHRSGDEHEAKYRLRFSRIPGPYVESRRWWGDGDKGGHHWRDDDGIAGV